MNRYARGHTGHMQALELVGKRVSWRGEPYGGLVIGTTSTRNGYPLLIVRWDAEVPSWWGTDVSPRNDALVFTDQPTGGTE